MKTLVAVHIVQFSMWDYHSFEIRSGGTGVIGPNGAGKTSLIDAVQIAMVGGHRRHLHFNAQSVHKDARTIGSYALGTMRSGDGEQGVLTRKRDVAQSFITLVFRGEREEDVVSAGICLHATPGEEKTLGLYVLPGVALTLDDHLEDLGAGSKMPIEWSVFAEQGRRLAKGGKVTITTRPEAYIDELLYALNPGIDARKFLRAFGHSINLKQVDSVGDFLRGYLVEATPIDKSGTLRHVKLLRDLGKQIEAVKQQLFALQGIELGYAKLAERHQMRATAVAAHLQFEQEEAEATAQKLEGELSALQETLNQQLRDRPSHSKARDELKASSEAVTRRLLSDPEHQEPAQREELRGARLKDLQRCDKDIQQLVLRIREMMSAQVTAFSKAGNRKVPSLAPALASLDAIADDGRRPTEEEFKSSLEALKKAADELKGLVEQAGVQYRAAQQEAEEAKSRLNAISKGMRLTFGPAARASSLFENAGIAHEPAGASVRVRDPHWQGAIETYLGSNRHAFVVAPGDEDRAVALIRREHVNDVTVVQPEHLKRELERPPEAGTVAELLVGDNPVALAYLRRVLGSTRQVETEPELRRTPRGLTRDYMLSANGGTKRLSPLPEQDWSLGRTITHEDRAAAQDADRAAAVAEKEASEIRDQLTSLYATVSVFLASGASSAKYSELLAELDAAEMAFDAVADLAAQPVSEELQILRDLEREAKRKFDAADAALRELEKSISANEASLTAALPRLRDARDRRDKKQAAFLEALQNPDCDHDQLPDVHARLMSDFHALGYQAVYAAHDKRMRELESAISRLDQQARDDFIGYINDHSVYVVDERSDWRKARTWVGREITKLRDSTLVEREQEAAAARDAAEASFRADVKYKMREAILGVGRELRDLNRLLDASPPFTNGERYRFHSAVAADHRELYNYITSEEDGESTDLFGQGQTNASLMALLEDSEMGRDKGRNPLEDYRLLFNFDLQIRQNGQVVDYLSKRMGVGSNGEHRVPFYVIAGVALATAYRIPHGKPLKGAGLMILDEAFYGMDAQNSLVTAEFLNSLGLQLLMAGPDSDVAKLVPVMDNYYDLSRFDADVFADHVVINAPAKALLTSDIPMLHPNLIDEAEARIQAEDAAR